MRVWKFLTFVFRSHGKHKYALAGLRLMASRLALLTPRQAHRLTWNRFANKQGGVGKCISRDPRLEKNRYKPGIQASYPGDRSPKCNI